MALTGIPKIILSWLKTLAETQSVEAKEIFTTRIRADVRTNIAIVHDTIARKDRSLSNDIYVSSKIQTYEIKFTNPPRYLSCPIIGGLSSKEISAAIAIVRNFFKTNSQTNQFEVTLSE